MARFQVANGRDSIQTQRIAADMLNNPSWTADKRWYSYKTAYYELFYDASNLGGAYGRT
jgi:hypothetical protein